MEDTTDDGTDEFWGAGAKEGCIEEAAAGIGPTMLEEGKVLEVTHG